MKKNIFLSSLISLGAFLLLSPILIKLVNYLHPIVLIVVLFCIFICVLFILLFIKKKSIHLSYSLLVKLLSVYSIALMILLFFRPNGSNYHSVNLIPFSTIELFLFGEINWLVSFYNLAANIGLFIPYGTFLMIRQRQFGASPFEIIFLPLISITMIELMQFTTHRGSLDVDDLILNMLGIYIGNLIYPVFKRFVYIKI
ncbi:VanZ family protein [Bacillus sp. CGMCC 1.16607]|uniref:VanZ family protein n=1 Tax=Bacillus sp. CGMCC 1.16607 TaxID=3351842 RepID=UPI0036414FD2